MTDTSMGSPISKPDLLAFYQRHVSTVLLPFWSKAIDTSRGGIFTCFDNSGRTLVSRNKYTWSQGRFVWLWSRLSTLAAKGLLPGDPDEFLRDAGRTVEFLTRHVFLSNGNCAYVLSESGEPIESIQGQGYDTSIYADCFVVLGFAEYARAVSDSAVLDRAIVLYDSVRERVSRGDFRTEPYPIPDGFTAHALTMILLRISQCLAALSMLCIIPAREKSGGTPRCTSTQSLRFSSLPMAACWKCSPGTGSTRTAYSQGISRPGMPSNACGSS